MTNDELNSTVTEYLSISDKLKEIEAMKKNLGSKILQHMKEANETKLLCEGIAKIALAKTIRDTPQRDLIEKKFGITLTSDCFKHSESESIRVTSLLVESAN